MTVRDFSFSCGPGRLIIKQGDITAFQGQAIVNAANAVLAGGGGVDGAIQRAAGPQLLAAGRTIMRAQGPLASGQAVITPGFGLSAQYVIHTVGPIWRGGEANEAEILAQAYANCLELAARHNIDSLAFPAISCGAYGFPVALAAPVALGAIARGLTQGLVREVSLILFSKATFQEFAVQAENRGLNPL